MIDKLSQKKHLGTMRANTPSRKGKERALDPQTSSGASFPARDEDSSRRDEDNSGRSSNPDLVRRMPGDFSAPSVKSALPPPPPPSRNLRMGNEVPASSLRRDSFELDELLATVQSPEKHQEQSEQDVALRTHLVHLHSPESEQNDYNYSDEDFELPRFTSATRATPPPSLSSSQINKSSVVTVYGNNLGFEWRAKKLVCGAIMRLHGPYLAAVLSYGTSNMTGSLYGIPGELQVLFLPAVIGAGLAARHRDYLLDNRARKTLILAVLEDAFSDDRLRALSSQDFEELAASTQQTLKKIDSYLRSQVDFNAAHLTTISALVSAGVASKSTKFAIAEGAVAIVPMFLLLISFLEPARARLDLALDTSRKDLQVGDLSGNQKAENRITTFFTEIQEQPNLAGPARLRLATGLAKIIDAEDKLRVRTENVYTSLIVTAQVAGWIAELVSSKDDILRANTAFCKAYAGAAASILGSTLFASAILGVARSR